MIIGVFNPGSTLMPGASPFIQKSTAGSLNPIEQVNSSQNTSICDDSNQMKELAEKHKQGMTRFNKLIGYSKALSIGEAVTELGIFFGGLRLGVSPLWLLPAMAGVAIGSALIQRGLNTKIIELKENYLKEIDELASARQNESGG